VPPPFAPRPNALAPVPIRRWFGFPDWIASPGIPRFAATGSDPGTSDQCEPPSVVRYRPTPASLSPPFDSPVPT
jgi:hypothetical protein